MKRRDPHQWLKQRTREQFFVKAKQEGYKARSAYKLLDMLKHFKITPQSCVLDLGAAPGAWTQVLLERTANVDAIDLLPMKISPRRFCQCDIYSDQAMEFLSNEKYDLILSDMAPNCSGTADDHYAIIELVRTTLQLALKHLKPGGDLCVKVFDGALLNEFVSELRSRFVKVIRCKPLASRADSSELYLVGKEMKANEVDI